ncbi:MULTISPECIES: DUF3102 domain-containing protein [Dehalobacter]|jgi:hypothetical protein|uniref:Preprotein translocase SecA n=1 Tax=Dehalobacter restrictus (strain DSM 9455 / PER-K23) TaxID=871738 RepID=A0ABM5P348_DEHRP|nr:MULTISPECIES: DUF3102 domain-containing protein [Dehalobacter]AHF08989.1 preprotein translocase SecA [Dehalobacter restrictus DSM 9455]MDJ0306092.1 DUF3102 domain-containing protein [Dehalobacter sp.]OCZ50426.1 preprotein translocase subunit SecA [Dehalobacter sp. TeCB1]
MENPATERTPLVIAAEINMITCQTKKILLAGAIEIGCRLQEAKALVKHGEWGKWLESVSYSQKTAERLIKLYQEYGPNFSDGLDTSKSTSMSNMTYTQALLLLGLPAEEREEFIEQNDVGGMTTKKLQQALQDRDKANQEKDQALQENQAFKKGLKAIDSTISELKKEQAKAASMPTNPENVKAEAFSASQPALPTHNLKAEHDPDAHIKYVEKCNACCKTIADTFFDLTTALTNLAHVDPNLKEEKRKEANRLIEYMAETIKEWPPPKKPLRVHS